MTKWLSVLLLLLSAPAWAAIAHDKSTVWTTSSTTGSCTVTHTPVGTPSLALLWVAMDGNEIMESTPTYGGQDMTLVADSGLVSSSDQRVWVYEKHSPLSGEQDAYANYSTDDHAVCIVQTFTGTDTSDATVETDTNNNATEPCDTITTTITLDSTASWMVTASSWQGGDVLPISETNFTARNEGATGAHATGDDSYNHGDSTGDSGNLTHTSDATLTDECAQVSVEIVEPYAAADQMMVIGAP